MKLVNSVKQNIKQGKPTFGCWIMTGNLAVAEILAQSGFDWLTIDMEHTSIDYGDLTVLLAGIQRHGVVPLVRIEENNPTVIKRVLDAGAMGIIVPMVLSGEEAEAAVKAAQYPPKGFRGVSLGRATDYGLNFDDYFGSINEEVIVLAQIEHYRGVENIEAILGVEGLDGVFIGPYDLSGSMNIIGQFDHPRMKEARQRVIETTQKAGKALGIHVVQPSIEETKTRLAEGFNFIACSLDTIILGNTARELVSALR